MKKCGGGKSDSLSDLAAGRQTGLAAYLSKIFSGCPL
jgi:hypothetical protein